MTIVLDGEYGYDGFIDYLYVDYIDELETMEEKMNQLKLMYSKDKQKYNRWKHWCMHWGELSDIFGTKDHPIEIDESKL